MEHTLILLLHMAVVAFFRDSKGNFILAFAEQVSWGPSIHVDFNALMRAI